MRFLPGFLLILLFAVVGFLLWLSPSQGSSDPEGSSPSHSEAGLAAPPPGGTALPAPAAGPAGREGLRAGLEAGAPGTAQGGRAASLQVLLLGPGGAPAIGARARLVTRDVAGAGLPMFLELAAPQGGDSGKESWEAEADASGLLRIEGLPPWRELVLEPTGAFWAGESRRVAPLAPGEARDLGELRLAAAARIQGTVRTPGDQPGAGAKVRLRLPAAGGPFRSPPPVASATADAQGRFTLEGVLPGRYVLAAELEGWTDATLSPFVVSRAGVDQPARLTLGEGFASRLQVVDADGQPVPEARVLVVRDEGPFQLRQADRERILAAGVAVDEGGRILLQGLPLDRKVRAAATAPGYSVTRSEPLVPGGMPAVVLARAAALSGQVLDPDGSPAAGAGIVLRPQDGDNPWPGPRERTEADEEGRFRFPDLQPGNYVLKAASPSGRLVLPELEVQAGEEPLEIRLEAARALAVSVQDETGNPVAGARVTISRESLQQLFIGEDTRTRVLGDPEGPEPALHLQTDADGQCRFLGLADGPWTVKAEKEGHVETEEATEVGEDGAELTLILPRAARLRVQVLDTAGLPVPRARVEVSPADETTASHGRSATRSTDALGLAFWPSLAPGRWRATLSSRRAGDTVLLDRGAGAMIRFAGEPEEPPPAPPDALELVLVPGALAEETLIADAVAVPRIRVERFGRPVAGALVEVEAGGGGGFGGGFPGAAGGIRTDGAGIAEPGPLPPGPYTVMARSRPGGPVTRKEVELGPGPQEILLPLATGVVRGTVVDAGGPVGGARVDLEPWHEEGEEEGGTRSARTMVFAAATTGDDPVIETFEQNPGAAMVSTAADGSFVFQDVPEGAWRIHIRAPGHSPLEGEPFSHDGRQDLDLGLQRVHGAAILTGMVLGLAPKSGDGFFSFRFLELEAEEGSSRFGFLRSDGSYRFGDLAPGRYRLRVREGGESWTSSWVEVQADRETPFDFEVGG